MARDDDYVPVNVRRSVAFHSNGYCQYRGCERKLVNVDSVTGAVTELGRYAHILPVGDAARAEYKAEYSHIGLHSFANIILLCSDHHDRIDKLEVDRHTPALLFRMKDDRSNLVQEGITAELQRHCVIEIEFADYARQYEVSAVLDEFQKARLAGPRHGAAVFKAAERTMLSLLKNPFFKKGELGEVLLTTEHIFTRLFLGYKRKPWLDAFQHIGRMLRLALPEGMYFHVLSCSLTLIRDEYGVFAPQEKLQVIAKILSSLDAKIDLNEKGRAAFILLIKSALLRWRGRFERGANQRNTYAEALRCSEKSFELSENPGCLLQKALVNYSSGLAFQFNEAPKHEPFFKACFDIMDSAELAEFPSAIKYRPRLYRETYRFSDSIRAFWEGASQYPAEFKRIAYVLGEAASGEYNHEDKADTRNLSDAKSFLEQAIREGYHHGRNLISYVGCRGILEPNWFQTTLLDNVMDKDGLNIEWEQIIVKIRDVIYDPHDKYDEPGFGVDSGEFWATLGGVTGRILRDHGKAIRLLRIAEHHAEVSSGKFRAYLGLALQYKEIGDAASHKVYIGNMQTVARAHQKQIVDELEKLVKG